MTKQLDYMARKITAKLKLNLKKEQKMPHLRKNLARIGTARSVQRAEKFSAL